MDDMMLAGVPGPEGLRITNVPIPSPAAGQVLVKIAAAGMNRADLAAAKALVQASAGAPPRPIGMEWAGEIVAVGAGVSDLPIGSEVACSGSGGYAEYAVADVRRCIPLDGSGLGMSEAATLPLALMTAHDALVTNGRFAAGDTVLVQAASSAVGLAVLQMAAAMGAGAVIGLSRDAQKRDRLAEFGATHAFDPDDPDLETAVERLSGGKGIDVIVDMVSGESVNRSMRMAALRGRIVNVGRLGGAASPFDFDLHALKRLSYVGVTFRTRTPEEIAAIVDRMRSEIWQSVVERRIALPLDRSFPLRDAPAAHSHMRANAHFGKIVLVP